MSLTQVLRSTVSFYAPWNVLEKLTWALYRLVCELPRDDLPVMKDAKALDIPFVMCQADMATTLDSRRQGIHGFAIDTLLHRRTCVETSRSADVAPHCRASHASVTAQHQRHDASRS